VEWIYAEEYGIVDEKEGLFQQVMYYDQDGNLWLGTDKGLVKIVVKKKGFHQIGPVSGGEGGLNYHKLNAVTVDQNDQLWVGSVGGGLFRSKKSKDGHYYTFDRYLHDPADIYSLAGNGISAIFEDSGGDIYIYFGRLVK
jgi:ligand-binding sensor domain-containing protein